LKGYLQAQEKRQGAKIDEDKDRIVKLDLRERGIGVAALQKGFPQEEESDQ
jgi:hypothetical protein